MNGIIFPLKPRMRGEAVADLQDGVALLLKRAALKADPAERPVLEARLHSEGEKGSYGQGTRRLVELFQQQHHLQPTGAVDEATAQALNAVLAELGAFGPATGSRERLVGGRVTRVGGQPSIGTVVRAFHVGTSGELRLGEGTTDVDGRYTLRYAALPGVDAIRLRGAAFGASGVEFAGSPVIENAPPIVMVDLIVPNGVAFRVEGRGASRTGVGVGGLKVRVVDQKIGSEEVPLAEGKTDPEGAYAISFEHAEQIEKNAKLDLQVRVLSSAGDKPLGAPEVRYNASRHEVVNVLLDAAQTEELQPEYDVLLEAIQIHFKGKLGDLEESDKRQDITYLANKTGWDARAVALAAWADKHSARTKPTIAPESDCALFRASSSSEDGAPDLAPLGWRT